MRLLKEGITISDQDYLCLKNDLIDPEQWIRDAVVGKVLNCRVRLVRQWHPRLLSDPGISSLPGTEQALISLITSRTDYQDRIHRDAESN